MKTININNIKIYEITILPNKQEGSLVFALLDDTGKEWFKKRATVSKSELTQLQLNHILKVIDDFKTITKNKEEL